MGLEWDIRSSGIGGRQAAPPLFYSCNAKRSTDDGRACHNTNVEMATTSTAAPVVAPVSETKSISVVGIRKNGKQWHEPKKAFRRTGGQKSYAKRVARESQTAEVKQIEKEMKQEKEDERQVSHVARSDREHNYDYGGEMLTATPRGESRD